MKFLLAILLVLAAVFCSSCGRKEPSPVVPVEKNVKEVVFNYVKPINIELNATPQETSLGYARVAGIITGNNMAALIEISGKGLIVREGEKLGPYVIKKIAEKGVILCSKS